MFRSLTCCFILLGSALGSEKAVSISRVEEVVKSWKPDQHLFVKGNIGVSDAQLSALEKWMDANAPNWTVVLMSDAQGESFQDASGESFHGMDAVEHRLGKQLTADTEFGNLKHPETKQANGAWFALFLRERKFSYFASEAYDAQGLGEDRWQGNLDAAAIRAMRNGGRIIDAARDTISTIDGELKRRLQRAAQERKLNEERARRFTQETELFIQETNTALDQLLAGLPATRQRLPDAKGLLVNPPIEAWRGMLTDAKALLAAGKAAEAGRTANQVRSEISVYQQTLAAHTSAPTRFDSLQQEMDAAQFHPNSLQARTQLLQAKDSLTKAREFHQQGDSAYMSQINSAEAALRLAREADLKTISFTNAYLSTKKRHDALTLQHGSAAAERLLVQSKSLLAAAELALEQDQDISQQLQAAETAMKEAREADLKEATAKQKQKTMMLTGGSTGGGLAFVAGWVGNRRRRRIREQARKLLSEWEESIQDKTEGLFQLMDRTTRAVGSSAQLEKSGWTGETQRLAQETIQRVDQLFIMLSGMDSVVDSAKKLILPANPLASGVNLVSGSRYEKAVRLLSEDPIACEPTALRQLSRQGTDENAISLLGRREDYAPVTMTFPAMNEAFTESAQLSLQHLDTIENAWINVGNLIQQLDAQLDRAEAAEKSMHEAAAKDDWFRIDSMFEKLLPSARDDHEAALKLCATDPVRTIQEPLATGSRKGAAAAALCELVTKTRQETLPNLIQTASALNSLGRVTTWVGAAVNDYSSEADRVAIQAVGESVQDAIAALQEKLHHLLLQTNTAHELTKRALESVVPTMTKTEDRIAQERTTLGSALSLPSDQILIEEGLNPTIILADARRHHAAALAELDQGSIAAATVSLDTSDQLCAEAHEIMDATRTAFDDWSAASKHTASETARISAMVPEFTATLRTLEKSWAPSALLIQAGDPTWPEANDSISNNISDATAQLQAARSQHDQASQAHAKGKLLTAADALQEGNAANAHAESQLQSIQLQGERLQVSSEANQQKARQLAERLETSRIPVSQHETMQPTISLFQQMELDLSGVTQAVNHPGIATNPFAEAKQLDGLERQLHQLETLLQQDRTAHEEALRSLQAALRQLQAGQKFSHQASTDDIPDSPATQETMVSLTTLQSEYDRLLQQTSIPHNDWHAIDQAADQLTTAAAEISSQLKNELLLGQAALADLNQASQSVRNARGWSGRYGVSISGSPGSIELDRARNSLSDGDYQAASHWAKQSQRAAQQAIAEAEAEEQRRRRAEQRRREEAERAAEAARRRQSSSSSFGGSSSSSSFGNSFGSSSSRSSGSSSGSSRSSFSSGSGASRSGW